MKNYFAIPGISKQGNILQYTRATDSTGLRRRECILQVVSSYYNLTEDILKGRCQKMNYVQARQVAMFIMRESTSMSLYEIGAFMKRNHATVIHSTKTVKNIYFTNQGFREVLNDLLNVLSINYESRDNNIIII